MAIVTGKSLPDWHCEHVEGALANTQKHLDNKVGALESSEEDANAEMLQVLTDHVTKQVLSERVAIDKVLKDKARKNEARNQAVVQENQDLKSKNNQMELKCQTIQAELLDWKQKFETAEKVVSQLSASVESLRKKHDEERKSEVAQACATLEHEKFELQSHLNAHKRQKEQHEVQAESWRTLTRSLEAAQSELREKLNSKDQQLRTKDHMLLAKDHELQTKDQEMQAMDQSLQANQEQLRAYAQEIKVKDENISQLQEALEKTIKEFNEKLEMSRSTHAKDLAEFRSQASDWEQATLSRAANTEHIFKEIRESGSQFGEQLKEMQEKISNLSEDNCKLRHDVSESQRRWQSYEEDERPALNKLVEKLQLEKAKAKAKEEAAHSGKRRSHVQLLKQLSDIHQVMAHHFSDGVKPTCVDSPDASTIHGVKPTCVDSPDASTIHSEEEDARYALDDFHWDDFH